MPRRLLPGGTILEITFTFQFEIKTLSIWENVCPRAKAEQHREEMAAKFAEMEERLRAREGDLQEAQANIR